GERRDDRAVRAARLQLEQEAERLLGHQVRPGLRDEPRARPSDRPEHVLTGLQVVLDLGVYQRPELRRPALGFGAPRDVFPPPLGLAAAVDARVEALELRDREVADPPLVDARAQAAHFLVPAPRLMSSVLKSTWSSGSLSL